MFALALAQVLAFAAVPRNATIAPIARWLLTSRERGFVFGGAIAVYGLLLRPVLYEALWFAPLYEYIALLALLVLALMFVVDLLRRDVTAPAEQEPVWSDWSHHRQVLESKADPRSALASAMRQRFVDYGDWKPLWSYLMGLLYRNGASQDWMRAACRPLRASAVSSSWLPFLKGSNLRRLGRMAALEEALRRTDSALASDYAPMQPVTEDVLRHAAAHFVESGADAEGLAIALTIAHCQQGLDLLSAVDRWFPLLDAPDPANGRFPRPWPRSGARLRHRHERVRLVDGASAMLFGNATIAPDSLDPGTLAELVGVPRTSRASGTGGA